MWYGEWIWLESLLSKVYWVIPGHSLPPSLTHLTDSWGIQENLQLQSHP